MKKFINIKRVFCLAVVICFSIFLTACNKGKKTTTTTTKPELKFPFEEVLAGANEHNSEDYSKVFGDQVIDLSEKFDLNNTDFDDFPFIEVWNDNDSKYTLYVLLANGEVKELESFSYDTKRDTTTTYYMRYMWLRTDKVDSTTGLEYSNIHMYDPFGNLVMNVDFLGNSFNDVHFELNELNDGVYIEKLSYYEVVNGVVNNNRTYVYNVLQFSKPDKNGLYQELLRTKIDGMEQYAEYMFDHSEIGNLYQYEELVKLYEYGDLGYTSYRDEDSDQSRNTVFDENMNVIFSYDQNADIKFGIMDDKVFVQICSQVEEHNEEYDFVSNQYNFLSRQRILQGTTKYKLETYTIDIATEEVKKIEDFNYRIIEQIEPVMGRRDGDTENSVVALCACAAEINNKALNGYEYIYFNVDGEIIKGTNGDYIHIVEKLDENHYLQYRFTDGYGLKECAMINAKGEEMFILDYYDETPGFEVNKSSKTIVVSEYSSKYNTTLYGLIDYDGKVVQEMKYKGFGEITDNYYLVFDLLGKTNMLNVVDGKLVSEVKDVFYTSSCYDYDMCNIGGENAKYVFLDNYYVESTAKTVTTPTLGDITVYDVVLKSFDGKVSLVYENQTRFVIVSNYYKEAPYLYMLIESQAYVPASDDYTQATILIK